VQATFAGAEGRYEDWIYLQMLQREWERAAADFERFAHFSKDERPSARAALVLLFWGYFETRLERLLRSAMRSLPTSVLEDALERYSSIGARLHRLYRIFFPWALASWSDGEASVYSVYLVFGSMQKKANYGNAPKISR
jgi:hypothetical protein